MREGVAGGNNIRDGKILRGNIIINTFFARTFFGRNENANFFRNWAGPGSMQLAPPLQSI